ncbi:YccF domain-containing protein [Undibacterium sp. Di26W]|uniref:YccF domain-containing protein n=1 Tax=Undibacterium sp. Di26W TaxID=3413035 RepID=UPI003BF3B31F
MSLIGNILWLVFGGFITGLAWWLVGIVAFISIIGIPWGRACFVIGQLTFMPFGKEVVDRQAVTGQQDVGTGVLGTIGNIIWFIFAGVWLAIAHLFSALFCFVTIIGIPFGIQHLKLAAIALAPIGKTVIDKEQAARLHR